VRHEITNTRLVVTTWNQVPAPWRLWILGDATFGVLDSTTVLGY
jgi:hypothetical protein